MAERIKKLSIPDYTRAQERFNMFSHEIGVYLSVAGLYFLLLRAILYGTGVRSFISALVYGISMVCLFVCSSLYHGAKVSNHKKLLRVLDHSTVYVAVAGTYTPYLLGALYDTHPAEAKELLFQIWSITALGVLLNFLNMEKLKHLLYGGCIALGVGMMVKIVGYAGLFHYDCINLSLIAGFLIAVGVIMYGVGSRLKWFHSVFHIFVLLSCMLFYTTILFFLI